MNLEAVGKLVSGHSALPAEVQRKIDRKEEEQIIVRRMFNWMIWGFIVLGIGVAMLVINKSLDIGKALHLLGSFFLLGGIGISMAGLLKGIRQGTYISGKRPTNPELPSANPRALPTNPFPEALPSVTEGTTKLISSEVARDTGEKNY